MKTKMAENHKGGILNKAEKILRRRKTKVLQSLGKQERTTDETLAEDCLKLDRQQEIAVKFQKDLRIYINHARALSTASKTFYTTVSEAYEPEWENHAQITQILTSMDMLWQDYLQKLLDQVQEPLSKYLACIPQIKSRVSKRGRKLIDYDNAKHNLDVLQNAKKKDDAKTARAQEDMEQAKKIYEDLNNELHVELPEFYNRHVYNLVTIRRSRIKRSRVKFYGNLFQSLFSAENVFQTEAGKGSGEINVTATSLSHEHGHHTYTPRKSVRSTIIVGHKHDKRRVTKHLSQRRSDENLTNGHSESGPESPQPDSPGPSPTSPTATVDVSLTNGTAEADTSKDSIEDGTYENTEFNESKVSELSQESTPEVKAEPSKDEPSKDEPSKDEPSKAEPSKDEPSKDEPSTTSNPEDKTNNESEPKPEEPTPQESTLAKVEEASSDGVTITVVPITTEVSIENAKPAADSDDDKKEEVKKDEVTVNGDLDTSTNSTDGLPDDAPPPVPSTPPPVDEEDGKPDEDSDPTADNVYEVPPPAKPVDDDLPAKYLYTVVATHAYKGEDDDELTFDAQEVIYVIDYDNPEEQDPGWLMGIRKLDRQMGVFPENFTKKV